MPEYYSSIGEAVGAAMQHNIRLAHRSVAPGSDKPLQVRHLPSASADPYSVRGMISRLHEDTSPDEVAGIIEEVNGALVGALPELTELSPLPPTGLAPVSTSTTRITIRLSRRGPDWQPRTGCSRTSVSSWKSPRTVSLPVPQSAQTPGTTRWSTSCAAGSCSTMSSVPRLLLCRPLPKTSIQTGSGRPVPPRRAPEHRRRPAVRRPPQHLRPRLVLPADPAETFRLRLPGVPP